LRISIQGLPEDLELRPSRRVRVNMRSTLSSVNKTKISNSNELTGLFSSALALNRIEIFAINGRVYGVGRRRNGDIGAREVGAKTGEELGDANRADGMED